MTLKKINYLRSDMKVVFTCCFILIVQLCFSQGIYPELTSKIGDYEAPILEKRVENIYRNKLKSNPKEELNLKLWKLYIYDSLKITGKADTLSMELVKSEIAYKYLESSKIYARLGNIEVENNEFKKAISYYHFGLKIGLKFRDIKTIGSFQRLIGTSYLKLVQNKTAEQYLRESLSSYKSINDSLGMANAAISLGNAMKAQENLKEGIKYYQMSLDLAKKLNNQRLIAGNYNNLGSIERRQKNYKKALDYFFKALDMNLKSNNQQWQSFNLHNIAMTYEDMKQFNEAIEFFKKSNDIKIEIGDSLSLIAGYESLSSAYAKVNDFENAYEFLKLHIKLKDTLNLVEQANLLKTLEAKYQSAQKESEISSLKMTNELEEVKRQGLEMKAQKNANLLTLAIFAGLILLGGVGLLLKANKSRRKANDLLNSKNEIIGSANAALQSALNELSEKNKEIIDSINYATYIQRATLPNITQHTSDKLQFELFFAPKDIVSGDFYFSYQLYNRSIFGVADCTGHGVPGAMVSLVGMNSLEKVIRDEKNIDTGEMVESLNQYVLESLGHGSEEINDGMDLSFCHLDHENNLLHFTGANHTAYIIRENKIVDENIFNEYVQQKGRTDLLTLISLNGTRRPIGKSHSTIPFNEVIFKLHKGDRIVLFSDGYADQIGGDFSKKLKKGALLDFILDSGNLSVSNQVDFMKSNFNSWKGKHDQVDDVCMLLVDIKS